MSTLAVTLMLYFIKLLIFLILKIIKGLFKKNKKWKKFMKIYNKMSNSIFFDSLLGMFVGAYFEFLIGGIFSC